MQPFYLFILASKVSITKSFNTVRELSHKSVYFMLNIINFRINLRLVPSLLLLLYMDWTGFLYLGNDWSTGLDVVFKTIVVT